MKKVLLLISLILILLNDAYASPYLLECNDCSVEEHKFKVLDNAWATTPFRELSTHYVIDLNTEKLFLYRAHIDAELGWQRVTGVTVGDDVKSAIQEFFTSRSNLIAAFESSPNMLSDLISSVNASGLASPPRESKVFRTVSNYTAENNGKSCATSDRGVYQFILDSQFRKNVFDKMLLWYPVSQSFINTWNNFVNKANITFQSNSGNFSLFVEGNLFGTPQTIHFPDGGVADVVMSGDGNTFDVVEGSAFDCDNNQIPTQESEFSGNFNFGSLSSFNGFQDYGSYFDIEFSGTVCTNNTFFTSCRYSGDGKYLCSYSCN
ncbi:hypothetical protein [Pseudidiomarina sp.]|uniref:hypothetical protein n=1 Tax=Pseudidiomarina sp. TaxID=2081707 RepID=UPI003A9759EF